MELNFSQLKQKEVISLADGKSLGKVCDAALLFPENKITGLIVTGGKLFKFMRQEIFLPVNCIVRIGEDAILVNFTPGEKPVPPPPPPPNGVCPPPPPPQPRRSFDEYE